MSTPTDPTDPTDQPANIPPNTRFDPHVTGDDHLFAEEGGYTSWAPGTMPPALPNSSSAPPALTPALPNSGSAENHLITDPIERRRKGVLSALGSWELEGATPSEEALVVIRQYVAGEISIDHMISRMDEKYTEEVK